MKEQWRLPTVQELLSVIDYTKSEPATQMEGFSNNTYWTSTVSKGYPSFAWIVDLTHGYSNNSFKEFINYVRFVRETPSGLEWSEATKMDWNEAMKHEIQ